jgi:disulfide bond formation protein DsbB
MAGGYTSPNKQAANVMAAWVALAVPVLLYGGALISQYVFGLHPCEMCYWQRWPHQAAIVLAVLALILWKKTGLSRLLTLLAAGAVLTSGAIGFFHAGVEFGLWEGLTSCSTGPSGAVSLSDIMAAPITRCDVPQWTFFGVSLAAFNGIFSLLGTGLILRYWKIGGKS